MDDTTTAGGQQRNCEHDEINPGPGIARPPAGTRRKHLRDQIAATVRLPAVRLTSGLGATGALGLILRQRWDVSLLHTAGSACVAVAAVMWCLRTLSHIVQGRLHADGLRAFTAAEFLLGGVWAASVYSCYAHCPTAILAPELLVALIGSFAVAQTGEAARTNLAAKHPHDEHYLTGRDWFLRQRTPHGLVSGALLADNLGRGFKSLTQTATDWLFSGMVYQLLVIGILGGLFLLPQQVGTPSDASVRSHSVSAHPGPAATGRPTGTVTPSKPNGPPPSATGSATPSASDNTSPDTTRPQTYQGICEGIGQQPGADDTSPGEQDRFVNLFLGPGANIAGCAQLTRRSALPGCAWEEGHLDGQLMSVAVLDAAGDDALFIGDSAVPVVAILNSGECVGGSDRAHVHAGDVQLIYTPDGTCALVRDTEYRQGSAAPHADLGVTQTRAWLQAMQDLHEWLWPLPDGTDELTLLDQSDEPVGANIVTVTVGSEQVSTVQDSTGSSTFSTGANIRWEAFQGFAA